MAWIELHQELPRHPKTDALMDGVGIRRCEAVGHIAMTLLWGLEFAHDGFIPVGRLGAVARAADWNGRPAAFAVAMVDAGWWDETDGGYRIHDWQEYVGRLMDKRRQDKERKAAGRSGTSASFPSDIHRTSTGNVHRTSDGRPQDGARNSNSNHVPTHDQPTNMDQPGGGTAHEHAREETPPPPPPISAIADEEFTVDASPVPGLPKGAGHPFTPEQLAQLKAALPPGQIVGAQQVPEKMRFEMQRAIERNELQPEVLPAWRDLDPAIKVLWCCEGMRRSIAAKRAPQWRFAYAAKQIGMVLQNGVDMLADGWRVPGSVTVLPGGAHQAEASGPTDGAEAIARAEVAKAQLADPEEARRGALGLLAMSLKMHGRGSPKLAAAMARHGVSEPELDAYLAAQRVEVAL